MAEGEKIRAEFQQPATAREVFAGADPCRFRSRKRTIGRYTPTASALAAAGF